MWRWSKKCSRAGRGSSFRLLPYYGCFDFDDVHQFAGALKELGFYGVSETAEGAAYVTAEYHRIMQENSMKNIISTCCPSVNRLIELYYPSLVDQMAPVVSPL